MDPGGNGAQNPGTGNGRPEHTSFTNLPPQRGEVFWKIVADFIGALGASSNVTTQTTGITNTSSYGCWCKMQ